MPSITRIGFAGAVQEPGIDTACGPAPNDNRVASTTAFVYIWRDRLAGRNTMTDAPKSAIDIVMERLRRKDAESGTEQQTLTDAQRSAIAEVRRIYEAQVAERRIMHRSESGIGAEG